ncbi:MAG: DUF3224 domain-containing protein [Caldilineae bacterium]|nr:DUF3224 domain-containing protein [Chloroflexota bacterium]MCB9176524.1 DUF3224 domain-containing protein [Caldilineae bacterium]
MNATARGTFEVELKPLGTPSDTDGVSLGRMSLVKRFTGDLVATANGEMLSARTPVEGSAGYVAIERVTGSLQGRSGSFVLQHSGIMSAGTQQLSIRVVPGSGTAELAGIRGELQLEIANGVHHYELVYSLPPAEPAGA